MYESFLKPFFADIKTFVLDTLFPIKCLICETENKQFLCIICKEKLKLNESQFCIVCKKPSVGGQTHPNCQNKHTPDGLISFYDYKDKYVSKLIIHGKYYFLKDVFIILGELAASKILQHYPGMLNAGQPLTLVPIPLHKWRQSWRGFNQAEILCEALSLDLHLPIKTILKRNKITKTQKNLNREERIKNIQRAFSLQNRSESLKNQNFILVDDVVTTGFTLIEAAKILKQNGAKNVWCLTVAKD